MTDNFKDISKLCPAYNTGCPYKTTENNVIQELIRKCPSLNKNQCPFKHINNSKDLNNQLENIFNDHFLKEHINKQDITFLLNHIHDISIELHKYQGQCPLFSNECLQKNMTIQGKNLLEILDKLKWNNINESTFSKKLKNDTKEIHSLAETEPFMSELMKGNVPLNKQIKFHCNLYQIYESIEINLDTIDNDLVKQIDFKELRRLPKLVEDLKYQQGENQLEILNQNKLISIDNQCKRIDYIAKNNPTLLIAHHQVRYLGDLSGGQIIKKRLKKLYSINDNALNFYEFDIENKHYGIFKNKQRNKLSDFNLNKEMSESIIAESIKAFELNMELFHELSMECNFNQKNKLQNTAKCPFSIMAEKTKKLKNNQFIQIIVTLMACVIFSTLIKYIINL